MNSANFKFQSLAVVLVIAQWFAASAAPTSTTVGQNANTSICKVVSQKGCKGVGTRGDQCCSTGDLYCNLSVPATCSKCLACVDSINYQTTPCGSTSNRVCTTCKSCFYAAHGTAEMYKNGGCTTANNVGTDTVCTACDLCSLGNTYETSACSASSNRKCSVCSTCTDGTSYQSSPCYLTANRVCTPCSAKCVAGEFSSGCESPGFNMNGADRKCTACTGVDGVATYVDAGVSCAVSKCKTGYELHNGVCTECVDTSLMPSFVIGQRVDIIGYAMAATVISIQGAGIYIESVEIAYDRDQGGTGWWPPNSLEPQTSTRPAGVITYVDPGITCTASKCIPGYELIDGVCTSCPDPSLMPFVIGQRVDRIEDRNVTGATVISIGSGRFMSVEIAYDEGGSGFWPPSSLKPKATGVAGVATYVDSGITCVAATCISGYELKDGVCEGE